MAWARLTRPAGAPASELSPSPLERVLATMERLTTTYGHEPWLAEMARARLEYEAQRGKIYQDEPGFEGHLAAFLEWYVLDRPLTEEQRPPVVMALRQAGEPESQATLRALALSCRSLFEVVEVLAGETRLHDLLRGGYWRVRQEPPLDGVDPEDIFEARLLPWEQQVRFGPLFCFHPRSARPSILALLEELQLRGQLDQQVLGRLALMRLNHDRFRNIAIDRIYSLSWRGSQGGERDEGGAAPGSGGR